MTSTLHTPENARRFNWWWRGLFVREEGPTAIGLSIDLKIIAPSIRWSKNPDVGNTFRSRYAGYERSACLYELERRVEGKYGFEVPWIELKERWRQVLRERWPDLPIRASLRSSHRKYPAQAGWTTPQWISFNLKLNDKALLDGFKRFVGSERIRLSQPNPHENAGVRRRPLTWLPIEFLDLQQSGLHILSVRRSTRNSAASIGFGAGVGVRMLAW